jgi:hypothetical protein
MDIIRKIIHTDNLYNEILLNKKITKVSTTNLYEILINSDELKLITKNVIENIKNTSDENFNVFCKNLWGYIQTSDEPELIKINSLIHDAIFIKPKWSFFYFIETKNTTLQFKIGLKEIELIPEPNELIIFPTKFFMKDNCIETGRIVLVGSISNNIIKSETHSDNKKYNLI